MIHNTHMIWKSFMSDCIFYYVFFLIHLTAKFQAYSHFEAFALLFLLGVLLPRYPHFLLPHIFQVLNQLSRIRQDGLGYAAVTSAMKTSAA